MDGYLATTIIAGMIVAGFTIAAVVESLYPKPQTEMTQFDVIEEELQRLHNEAETYTNAPTWITNEINRLNAVLIGFKDDKS